MMYGWIAFAATVPIVTGLIISWCVLKTRSVRWHLILWIVFVAVTLFWTSVLLPSLNNERGWEAAESRGLVLGIFLGSLAGLALLTLGQIRSKSRHERRGFPIDMR